MLEREWGQGRPHASAKAAHMTQAAVSMSVKRGEKIAKEHNFEIDELIQIHCAIDDRYHC
jgi:hypothetical protein